MRTTEGSAPQTTICDQFYPCIVRNAACVLGGTKPAALFNFTPRAPQPGARQPAAVARDELDEAIRTMAGAFNARYEGSGLRVDVLFVTTGRALLLVNRPSEIDALLDDSAVAGYLTSAGYATGSREQLVASMRDRVLACERTHADGGCANCPGSCFPHEVGLLLGYPLEDVRGFIEHRGRGAHAVGPWKVYGDPAEARRRWDSMRECRKTIIWNYANGTPFEALIA